MASIELPPIPGSPLLITAPVARCGTTLLQRLFNSSDNLLVFGESVSTALGQHVEALYAQAVGHLPRREQYEKDLLRVLAGEQFWCPHIMPEANGYVSLWLRTAAEFMRYHENEAKRVGRELWGAKCPAIPVSQVQKIRTLIPGSRVVYVIRDVFDAVRSAKSREFVISHEDVAACARRWATGLAEILALAADPNLFILRLEDLENVDEEGLRSLEEFTGARGLDRQVLATKVNTWTSQSEQQYTEPAVLSADEERLVADSAGEAIELFRSLDPAAA